nr:hypothetical protein [Tanacetum cinerariifolium]GEW82199.1 hypothetical protein [Tanacetum cinerariifolium]
MCIYTHTNSDYDFYPSDDQSFSDEDFPKEIYSNPLFDEEIISMKIDPHNFNAEYDLIESLLNHDSSIISSSKIDSFFDEFIGELILLKSIPPRIDETDCYPEEETHFIKRLLYDNSFPRPPKEFFPKNSDAEIEYFSPSPIPVEDSDSLMEEIDLSFTLDYLMTPGIEEDDYDSEREILILEEFLSNNSLSLPENKSFHFDIPSFSRPPAKPQDGILGDKIICDLDKTLDLSQRSPQNYPKCGYPVDGHYCQGCALLRKKFTEDLFTSCIENGILQDSFEPSNENNNVVNGPREPFEPFNNQTVKELPSTMQSFDPKFDLIHNSPNVFDPPPQLPFYSCEFCWNDALGQFKQKKEEEKEIKEDQAANARYWKIPACYDDDDDDFTFEITPNEPENSLSMGDTDTLIEEIDLSFTSDYPMSPGIEKDDYDSEKEILILEELLSNNSLSLPENESFHFDIALFSRPPTKPPDSNTRILNAKVMGHISEQKVYMPRLMLTLAPN